MKKFTFQAILLLIIIGMGIIFYSPNSKIPNLPFFPQAPIKKELLINDSRLKVEIVDTQVKRSKGLGGRESLASDEGMLFVFLKEDKYPFWMKGVSFPLDFVWIKGSSVIDILENVPPPSKGQTDDSLPIYLPKEAVDKLLEVNVGIVKKLNVKIGNEVKLL